MSSGRSNSTAEASGPTAGATPLHYVGRFAPSPSGPLHAGGLLAALGSFLDAKHHRGRWLLRIDDLDLPRAVAGASDAIRRTLDCHGLHWDGAVVYQSSRNAAYAAALQELAHRGDLFFCTCSRQVYSDRDQPYPGTCRGNRQPPTSPAALRLRVPDQDIHVVDLLQGERDWNLTRTCGDFVVRRRDGLFAYQLAVVVDDAAVGVTHVVRGADLLDNTARQQYLQSLLKFPTPRYLHLPLLLGADGAKLSKQNHAPALQEDDATTNLTQALQCLGHAPPLELEGASPDALLAWATEAWQRTAIPRMLDRADAVKDRGAASPSIDTAADDSAV